jgi:CubicO group peptidase (beta-lactamase class C family)
MRQLTIVLLFVSLAWLLHVPPVQAQKLAKIDEYVQSQLNGQNLTGLAVGIIIDGKVVKTKGYGLANAEWNIAATEHTVYKLASVSKQMIAAGIMSLVQQGRLHVTDTITRFFKDAPATWSNITLRHLLNHTSGLQRESPAFDWLRPKTDSVLIRAAYEVPLVFATGTRWQYCNLGYFMLAEIIRLVSGQPFGDYLQQQAFGPIGMEQTQTTSARQLVPNRAGGYVRSTDNRLMNAEEALALRPSGAFLSSIADLMKWELMIQQNKWLSKDSWQQMWTDTVSTDRSTTANTRVSYGYGWQVSQFKNRRMVFHDGSLPGFRSSYLRFPDERTAIVVLINCEPSNANAVATGIANIIFSD